MASSRRKVIPLAQIRNKTLEKLQYKHVDDVLISDCTPEEELQKLINLFAQGREVDDDVLVYGYLAAARRAIYYCKNFQEGVRLISILLARPELHPLLARDVISMEGAVATVSTTAERRAFISLFSEAVATWHPTEQQKWLANTSST